MRNGTMNKRQRLQRMIEKAYVKDHELARHQGDELSLVFYDATRRDLSISGGFFHTEEETP